jgi:hypothetical protein
MWDPVFRPAQFTEREAYAWSVERAAYADHTQWFNMQEIPVRRGEFACSLNAMAEVFGWKVKRVRLFLDRMIRAGRWAKRKAFEGAKAPTVLIICDYEEMQAASSGRGKGQGSTERLSKDPPRQRRGTEQKEMETKGKNGPVYDSARIAGIDARNRAMGRF